MNAAITNYFWIAICYGLWLWLGRHFGVSGHVLSHLVNNPGYTIGHYASQLTDLLPKPFVITNLYNLQGIWIHILVMETIFTFLKMCDFDPILSWTVGQIKLNKYNENSSTSVHSHCYVYKFISANMNVCQC